MRHWMTTVRGGRQELAEAIRTDGIHAEALDAMQALFATLTRNDLLLHYGEKVRGPVGAALGEIARRHENPARPIRLVVDFESHAGHLGKFVVVDGEGWIAIELKTMLDLDDPKWEPWDAVVDLGEIAGAVAQVFAHEFMHYLQRLPAWDKPRRAMSSRVHRAGVPDAYLGRSYEVQAHATDAARDLRMAYGGRAAALAALRSQDGIKAAMAASSSLRRYAALRSAPGGQELFRGFLRHLVQQIAGQPVTEAAEEVTFRTECRGHAHGQLDLTLVAEIGGRPVGCIEYSVYERQPAIQHILVKPDARRRGIASRMLRQLQAAFPGIEIDWGMLTQDGAALRATIGTEEVEDHPIRLRMDLLARLRNKEADLLIRAEAIFARGTPLSAEQYAEVEPISDMLNRVRDMIRRLESCLYGKKRTKTLIRTTED